MFALHSIMAFGAGFLRDDFNGVSFQREGFDSSTSEHLDSIEWGSAGYRVFHLVRLVAFKKAVFLLCRPMTNSLLAAGVLGDCLGSLANSVFGEFTRQQETNSSLDLPGGDGRFLVVVSES